MAGFSRSLQDRFNSKKVKKVQDQKLIFFARPRPSPAAKLLVLICFPTWDWSQGPGGASLGPPGGADTYVIWEGGTAEIILPIDP